MAPTPTPRTFLRILLTIFIGILVASFVSLGIAAFYPAPSAPIYPVSSVPPASLESAPSLDFQKSQADFNLAQTAYQQDLNRHNRNVSIFALIAAILILAISLFFLQDMSVIADGLLLGGLFTLIYSLVRATESDNSKFQFLIVAAGLAITLGISYLKLVKPVPNQA